MHAMTPWAPWLLAGLALAAVLLLAGAVRRLWRTAQENERRRETERARATLLQNLLDASPAAVVLYGDTGRIVFANEQARQLFFGDAPAEGHNFLRLVAAGPEPFRAPLLGQGGELATFDVEGRRETYHFGRRTVEHAGEPHTLLVVRHVTREVARQELDVLKRVVRLLSHEVNNALAPVSSLVHSARKIVRTGERLERLETVFSTIDERARHLSQFIAGYAALARLPPPVPRELAWEPLLSRLRALYPEATLAAPPDAHGHFDAGQVEQALINLLKNACESGGAAHEVSLEVRTLDDGASEVEVRDRGLGFTSEALEHAVLPFFTTKPGGSGVGLALVREIADAHGGQLRLGSRPGGGAVVTLRLPDRRRVSTEARARLTLTRG